MHVCFRLNICLLARCKDLVGGGGFILTTTLSFAVSTKGYANESHTCILLVLSVRLCCFNDMLSLGAGARTLGDRHRPTESANELPAETARETASADSGARIRLGGRAGDLAQPGPRQAELSQGGTGCGRL